MVKSSFVVRQRLPRRWCGGPTRSLMKDWFQTEDGWAVWIGLLIFALSLALLGGTDALGWGVTTKEWVDPAKATAPASKTYADAGLPGWGSLALTFVFLLTVLTIGAWALGLNLRQFVPGFAVIFAVSYLCIFLGNY